ncbi:hypothetical protein [Chryseobacterium bernardetii]|uniref:hypothetical protein n=1 Tax=Chryseobacterium bernardetii TaxID=1241978 RepID=UPI003AF6051F
MNFEIIKILTPITNVVLGALLSAPILSFFEQIKKRKLKNYIESQQLIDKLDEDFQNDFIKPNLKEIYFYLQTGISTNEKSIIKYIDLKNKLGGNYTWKKIKLVQQYINLGNNTDPLLKINKIEDIFSRITTWIIIILITSSAIGGILLNFFSNDLPIKDYLYILFLILIPLVCGIFLMRSIESITTAKAMMKRLNQPVI